MSKYGLNNEPSLEGFLEFQNSKVAFHKFGGGERLLIAFHGYGDQALIFLALEPALKKDYTLYAIDLPYHGQTEWQSDSFSKKNVLDWIDLILKKETKNRFELMGYSYGGRIILSLISELKNYLDKIYLIAPDGIDTKGMFSASIPPVWLRRVLKGMAKNPDKLIRMAAKFHKIGWLSSFNFYFIQTNLATEKRRERLFYTWISLKDFEVDLRKVRSFLKEQVIPVELYFGKYDQIIPLSAGEKLRKGIPNIRLNIIDEGHRLINEKLNQVIADQLNED